VPEFLGRYAVRRRLGAGGFAVVWLCHDDRLDDEVAVKVLADNHADRVDVRERFIHEARVLRRTTSQHVVEVYDIGELRDGRPYFVMTYADSGSLADALGDGELPVDEALRVGADVARGVQDLHDAGVVHRDVKPSNVLFRTAGDERRVLVADLGLSREMIRGSRITLTAGTPGFMAPEQATNSGVDHRTDVYGIGATVYCALTGREPPADAPPPPPSRLRPGLTAAVDEVVLRALAPDPNARWPTAAELSAALDALRDPATPVPALASAQPVSRPTRPRGRVALSAAAGVVVVAATVATVTLLNDSSTARTAAPAPTTTTSTAGTTQPTTTSPPTTTVTTAAGTSGSTAPTDQPALPPKPEEPVPGTRVACAVLGGADQYECFLHARGNTDYLLDFYEHNHEVVLWGLKSDDDQFAYSQRWQFWRIDAAHAFLVYNARSDRCLTLDDDGEVGAQLHVTPCDPQNANQLWEWTNGTSQVLRSKQGTCLDIPRGEYWMGAAPFAYDCNGGVNQQWLARPT
jgi:serine/threonine protein kinase